LLIEPVGFERLIAFDGAAAVLDVVSRLSEVVETIEATDLKVLLRGSVAMEAGAGASTVMDAGAGAVTAMDAGAGAGTAMDAGAGAGSVLLAKRS
jgi:hypothetical protein